MSDGANKNRRKSMIENPDKGIPTGDVNNDTKNLSI